MIAKIMRNKKIENHKMESEMKFNLRQRQAQKCSINETFVSHFLCRLFIVKQLPILEAAKLYTY